MIMEKGHMGLRELSVLALLIIGLTTAVFLITDGIPTAGPMEQAVPAQDVTLQTESTLGELFEQAMARADSRFYDTDPNGTYDIRTYRWALPSLDEKPDAIPIKQNDLRAAPVRFNDRYDDGLRGFAYRTYQRANLTSPPLIIGTAVFISDPDMLDSYLQSGQAFDIRYDPHPQRSQILEDCSIISSSTMTSSGTPVKVYDVACRIVYGANP